MLAFLPTGRLVSSHRRTCARAALLACLALGTPASAQEREPARIEGLAGAVNAHFLASSAPDFGGALAADLWYASDVWRVGGFFGVGAVPSPDDAQNRVFMPLAVSVAIESLDDPIGFSLRVRGGLWGGATQAVKITAGGLVGGGAYLLFALGPGVALSVGLDVWALFGDGETVLFAPSLGLSFASSGGP